MILVEAESFFSTMFWGFLIDLRHFAQRERESFDMLRKGGSGSNEVSYNFCEKVTYFEISLTPNQNKLLIFSLDRQKVVMLNPTCLLARKL